MSRLRIRIELSRGGVGVPLRKLASVIAESQKFLNLLTEDVRVDKQSGEWLGFDFDPESLNFTAEYVGRITNSQVEAFNAAFNGTTSLRRDTIGQFLRITDSIGDDEIIGFGLYQAEDSAEPTEWRCLSRRDALRIADEVKVLLGSDEETRLPSVGDQALGARIFGDRRHHVTDGTALEHIRTVETGLTTRIQRLEDNVAAQSGALQELQKQASSTESSVLGLLSTFEGFCEQATKKIEQIAAPPMLPAPPPPPAEHLQRTIFISAVAVLVSVLGAVAWYSRSPLEVVKAKQEAPAAVAQKTDASAPRKTETPHPAAVVRPDPAPKAASTPKPAAAEAEGSTPMQLELDASEPTWVSVRDSTGRNVLAELISPGSTKTVTLTTSAVLRAGNAGGLIARLDGQPVGSIGPNGQVREVELKNGKFRVLPPAAK